MRGIVALSDVIGNLEVVNRVNQRWGNRAFFQNIVPLLVLVFVLPFINLCLSPWQQVRTEQSSRQYHDNLIAELVQTALWILVGIVASTVIILLISNLSRIFGKIPRCLRISATLKPIKADAVPVNLLMYAAAVVPGHML